MLLDCEKQKQMYEENTTQQQKQIDQKRIELLCSGQKEQENGNC